MPKNDITFKTAYGAKMRVAIATGDGITEQHHKNEVDVNNIVQKYNKTGLIDHVNEFEKKYADVSGFDYQTAMNTVAAANTMFEQMPSHIRKRFENDPAKFLTFCDNEKNKEEMYELGLAERPFVPADETRKRPVKASEDAETEVKADA